MNRVPTDIYFIVVFICVRCHSIPVEIDREPSDELNNYKDSSKPLFLTPLIQASNISQAQNLSKVAPDVGNITSYSGFLTTNETCGNNLFFWFFPAQEDWENAPLLLWLNGGPGFTSIFGLFVENGPFSYSIKDGLKKRKYSWNVKHNLLFIDQPVGTGFSFTEQGCYAEDEAAVGENLYSALIQFLQLFPNLQQNKFFITGESYAGHYIPAIGYTIHIKNPSAKLKINLAGMMIGGAFIKRENDTNSRNHLYHLSLINDYDREEVYSNQKRFVQHVGDDEWKKAPETNGYNTNQFDMPKVSEYSYLSQNILNPSDYIIFINTSMVRESIHVGNLKFEEYSEIVSTHLLNDFYISPKSSVEVLLENGYPMVYYNGEFDGLCPYSIDIRFLRSLDWSGEAQYLNATRREWYEGGELAGYIRSSNQLADVLVKGAAHNVPTDQPFWAYQLVNMFTSGALIGKHSLEID